MKPITYPGEKWICSEINFTNLRKGLRACCGLLENGYHFP